MEIIDNSTTIMAYESLSMFMFGNDKTKNGKTIKPRRRSSRTSLLARSQKYVKPCNDKYKQVMTHR